MPQDRSLAFVLTTIQAPTPAVEAWLRKLPKDTHFVVIGDAAGPLTYDSRCDFYSLEKQKTLSFESARVLPTKHYSRKNLGYLIALERGASVLYETDDDNYPKDTWAPRYDQKVVAEGLGQSGWVNVFKYFTDEHIWPRGLPLDEILKPLPALSGKTQPCSAPIQQGLADGEPDVDAIWRLVFEKRITFRSRASVFLERGVWCPFNSQSTWWHREAFPLLYLPSFCSFRMTDIWRSFVAQRCLWEMGAGVAVHAAEVEQLRNAHILIDDFKKETDGYLRNKALAQSLQDLTLQTADPIANIVKCYEHLVSGGFFPKDELALLNAWATDIAKRMG